ncbi:MAG: TraR/DksA C4-type zinc finger protein [Balneola sp.]
MSSNETPVDNTALTEKELDHFRNKLVDEQKEAEYKINELEQSLKDIEANKGDRASSSAHHQGNLGSLEEQRETKYALIEKQKRKLEKINVALDRIATGNYGTCVVTGDQIQRERLEIMPYAVHSVDAMKGNIEPDEKERLSINEATG